MTTVNDIENLFRSNYPAMFVLACRMLHDEELARDIVHDIFASLLKDRPSVVTPAYLLQGVRYACIKHIRHLSIHERMARLYAMNLSETEDDKWPDDDDIARLNALIDSMLTEKCRRVVKLRFGAFMSYREIADELGISEVAVYKHLRHALNVLRQNFKSYEG